MGGMQCSFATVEGNDGIAFFATRTGGMQCLFGTVEGNDGIASRRERVACSVYSTLLRRERRHSFFATRTVACSVYSALLRRERRVFDTVEKNAA